MDPWTHGQSNPNCTCEGGGSTLQYENGGLQYGSEPEEGRSEISTACRLPLEYIHGFSGNVLNGLKVIFFSSLMPT